MFIQCRDENVKKDFLFTSIFYFNGYVVRFLEWIPDFKEELLKFSIPTWVSIHSLPPKLLHIEILRNIGSLMGNLIGIDASYKYCNNIKFFINYEINTPKF